MKTWWIAMPAAALALTALQATAQRAVILVRHAELQGQAMSQPADTPLSDEGRARATRLAELLQPAGITAVYATEYVRTRATASPLAERQGVAVTVVNKSESSTLAERLRREHPDGTVLVVAHSDTLPTLVSAYGHGADAGRVEKMDHGQVFVLSPAAAGPATLVRLRY
jgi:broad specificity phosphatase PhoE